MTLKIARAYRSTDNLENKPCKNACLKKKLVEVHRLIPDENDKAMIMVTTKEEFYWTIDIETVEELFDLIKEVGHDLIIGEDGITIYDCCIE